MKVEIVGENLVITCPINPNPAPSKSGKTLIVCSSNGNVTTSATVKGKPIVVGLNAYISK
jgi:hypothetical protein